MPRLTLADLKNQVYSRLEDNELMYSSTEVTNAINDGLRTLNMMCGWYQKTYSIPGGGTTVAGRVIYDIPSQILFPQRVVWGGKVLEKSPLGQTSNEWPNWMKDTSNNTGTPTSRWIPIGINKFAIHPADSLGGATLEVTGIENPVILVIDTDVAYIPKEGVTAVVDYAAHAVQCKLQGLPFMQSLGMYRNFESLMKLNKYWQSYRQPNLYYDEQSPSK